jgi:hypothetical protein
MTPLNDENLMARIALSDLKEKYDKFIAVKDDPTAKQNRKGIAQSMFEEMEDGILRGAKYACNVCVDGLPKLPTKVYQKKQQAQTQHEKAAASFQCAPSYIDGSANMKKVSDQLTKWALLHHEDSERGSIFHDSEERAVKVSKLSKEFSLLTREEQYVFHMKRDLCKRRWNAMTEEEQAAFNNKN